MRNEGLGMDVNEVRSVLEAVDSDAKNYYCKNCGHALSDGESKSRCGVCNGRQMVDVPPYRCRDCKEPVCVRSESCRCGCREAIRSNAKSVVALRNPKTPRYSCSSCLRSIPSLDAFPTCPGCGSETAWKNVEV